MIAALYDKLKPVATDICGVHNSYIYARINHVASKETLISYFPEKIESIILLLIKSGDIEIEINMDRYAVEAPSVVVIHYGATFSLYGDGDVDICLLAFSTDFLHSVNINFSAISLPNFAERQSPAQTLTKSEAEIMSHYYELMRINARAKVNQHIESNIAASLMAAMVYQQVQFRYKRIDTVSSAKGQRSSRNSYVHDFMKLVQVHYSRERGVRFYADKLCISPKYLSLLVKETTGKSAAHWIDDFVLMEAKNLLRFSGKNVQQVAYALNFTNQSSFGKFFKHLTGQSPTEYQKS
ncbi:MAG: helix-turn-helix domain-containing protein [Muribaculaceae bacterium]|nr:helix-turn-helix domain-containing protein [Muribaculaceae bacterium]